MAGYDAVLLDSIRKRLEEEKTNVASRLASLSTQDPFADPDRASDNAASDTEAFEESNHDRVSAQLEELQSQLTAIDAALLRVGNGTYGTCSICGRAIEPERLAVLPTATVCLEHESKRKQ
ncbi:TraR/DksA C4-type zinc finger protein [Candidatus Gottesmanbacteria bacterium]|nr:TraR/DksA C4-type zinc finger protein [Candidatus Gottesmanbacteria bacterium]